ncbi:sporulation protein [Niallia circulans]|uniref:Sporulation protein n=1 Tax=Niallia circulans TaxID=1397 RepID=A0A268F9F0_NIACI|nr:CAP domain-containing protein [Niallia circulans]AYV66751.1 sporulation protein [Niallia circulans]AYV70394.1 sporulation protein [Niallia circulans]PAD82001.1 sporulation protein [Niallia circulans]
MKKKNLILSVAAASTLLMATPLANKAEASTVQPQEAKTIYQAHNLSEEQLNKIFHNIASNYHIDIDKVLNELIGSMDKQQASYPVTKQKDMQKEVQKETVKPKETAKSKETAKPKETQKETAKPKETNNVQQQSNSKPNTTTQQNTTSESTKNNSANASSSVSAFEKQVVDLTNKERAKNGLPALTLDNELSKVAKAKSQDMSANNYFDHTSPTYGSPFDMMKQFGVTYKAAGENIAKGQRTPEEVVNAWMNSEGHRANILSNKFTHIGVGYVENGNYWTQQFIGK